MQTPSTGYQILGLLFWIALCFATAATGAWASMEASSFYGSLTQPDWAPPAWIFGPVWTTLFAMMAVSSWLVWRKGGLKANAIPLGLFVAQLVLNGLWSWLFFAWHLGGSALADLVVLWMLILGTILAFWRVSRPAALLLVPYIAWVTFAGFLNFSVWQLNPQALGR